MKKLKLRVAAASLLLLLSVVNVPAGALAAVPKCRLSPESTIRFEPPESNRAIQSFDYGPHGDVYFTQPSKNNTRLSRCSRTAEGTCVQRDSVVLPDYGHGESLEVYAKKGRTYVWLGSGAGNKAPHYRSKTVSLIEYIKAPTGSNNASFRRVGTLKDLAAVAPGKSGSASRAAVALADGQDRIALRVQIGGPRKAAYYGIYEEAALTALMKKAPGNKLSIAKAKKLLVSQFKEPKTSKKSFQGFDIKDDGATSKYLYVFRGFVGQTPTIYLSSWQDGGTVARAGTYVMKGGPATGLEAEGIKVEPDPMSGEGVHVQIGFKPNERDDENRRIFRLYRLAAYAPGQVKGASVLPPCPAADSPGQEKVGKEESGQEGKGIRPENSNLSIGELPGGSGAPDGIAVPPMLCEDPLLQRFAWSLMARCPQSGEHGPPKYPLGYYR